MKNLLEHWDDFRKRLESGCNLLLFLDYDGTLSPLAARPEEAVLSAENKRILQVLARQGRCHPVIVTGRAVGDIRRLVGVQGIDYVGNHGLEIQGAHIQFESLIPPQVISTLNELKYELSSQFSSFQGVFVEDKGLTLSVHYRTAPVQQELSMRRIFERVCLPYSRENKIRINEGKKVLELRPPIGWDKGKAALWLLKKQQLIWGAEHTCTAYLGDDLSDEDAFKALDDKGFTVFVGQPKGSAAQYYLNDTGQVTQFLKRTADVLQERS